MTTIDYDPPPQAIRGAHVAIAVAWVAVVLTVCGFVVLRTLSGPSVKLIPFNSAQWLAAPNIDATLNSVRLRMADSFLARQRPVGKTRAQVVALLGEPDDTPYFRNYDMVYYLGPERGAFGIDSEWLVFKLSNGVVVDARLVTD